MVNRTVEEKKETVSAFYEELVNHRRLVWNVITEMTSYGLLPTPRTASLDEALKIGVSELEFIAQLNPENRKSACNATKYLHHLSVELKQREAAYLTALEELHGCEHSSDENASWNQPGAFPSVEPHQHTHVRI